jgi:hypothetical protein
VDATAPANAVNCKADLDVTNPATTGWGFFDGLYLRRFISAALISTEGSVTAGTNWNVTTSKLVRVGGVVSLHLVATAQAAPGSIVAYLPAGFRPINSLNQYGWVTHTSDYVALVTIVPSDGSVILNRYDNGTSLITAFAWAQNDSIVFDATFACQ